MSKNYCNIYKKLVQSDSDMVGHIAYSVYKSEKVQYIDEYKQHNNTNIVPDNIINKFVAGRDNKKSIEHYREIAEKILSAFIVGSTEDMSVQVTSEVINKLTEHIDNKIVPQLPNKESGFRRFFNGCLQSIAGAIALSFLIWLFANVVGQFSLGKINISYDDGRSSIEQNIEKTPFSLYDTTRIMQ